MSIENLLDWNKWGLVHKNFERSYKIFISKELEGVPKNELFPRVSTHPTLPDINFISHLKTTSDSETADYVLVPHSWRNIKGNKEYLNYLEKLSLTTPLLLVNSGDITPRCTLKNAVELRMFLHPWEKSDRKIVLPYPVKEKKFVVRGWKIKPRISFMGYVPKLGPGSLMGENLRGFQKPIKSSVFINRKVSVSKLRKLNSKFDIHVEKRPTFTAYSSNPNLNQHMLEYDNELSISDYILCPRGSGNTSIRFFETLSSGATPILIDSGGKLPDVSSYDFWRNNIVNVKLFRNWSNEITKDWEFLREGNNYKQRQIQNSQVFLNELKFEVYLRRLFSRYLN